jgi:hypothetical protein
MLWGGKAIRLLEVGIEERPKEAVAKIRVYQPFLRIFFFPGFGRNYPTLRLLKIFANGGYLSME